MLADLLTEFVAQSWAVLREAAPFMLFGFLVAGLLKALLPESWLSRHLGGRGLGPVLKGALIGVPLPLCSCGVLPAALGLRRQGAGPGATTAFMIATPETGVDSMAVTWAMIDPLMTVLRPVAAFITAMCAGLAANLLPGRLVNSGREAASSDSGPGCGCAGACRASAAAVPPTRSQRLREGLHEAFGDMLADVGGWMLLGVLVAGAIAVLLPADALSNIPGGDTASMFAMLLMGIPMYVCATSSTPIAASLLLKGLSPGAALVFLLAGPATNAATITAMTRSFGPALTAVYVVSIAACAFLLGHAANMLYRALGFNIHAVLSHSPGGLPGWLETASALALLALILRAWVHHRKHVH